MNKFQKCQLLLKMSNECQSVMFYNISKLKLLPIKDNHYLAIQTEFLQNLFNIERGQFQLSQDFT
jgi:hypothetical protein